MPSTSSLSEYNEPLQLIHSNICGTSPVTLINGFKYYVRSIDAFSKYTWIYLLKAKSEVLDIFQYLKKTVELQLNKQIKVLPSNWGGELRSLTDLLKSLRIIHRVSCPYIPEQNGVAEHKHRHCVETSITLLAHSSIPLRYYDDAFTTVAFLINRLPTKSLDYKSPLEVLYKIKPNYSSLGSTCYPYLRHFNKSKLEYRSQPCTFLG